jgi:hypothetical protein
MEIPRNTHNKSPSLVVASLVDQLLMDQFDEEIPGIRFLYGVD